MANSRVPGRSVHTQLVDLIYLYSTVLVEYSLKNGRIYYHPVPVDNYSIQVVTCQRDTHTVAMDQSIKNVILFVFYELNANVRS